MVKNPFASVADAAPTHPLTTVDAAATLGTRVGATSITHNAESTWLQEWGEGIVASTVGEGRCSVARSQRCVGMEVTNRDLWCEINLDFRGKKGQIACNNLPATASKEPWPRKEHFASNALVCRALQTMHRRGDAATQDLHCDRCTTFDDAIVAEQNRVFSLNSHSRPANTGFAL